MIGKVSAINLSSVISELISAHINTTEQLGCSPGLSSAGLWTPDTDGRQPHDGSNSLLTISLISSLDLLIHFWPIRATSPECSWPAMRYA
jgi:hypothetical protein